VTQVTLAGFGSDWWSFRLTHSGRGVSGAASARLRLVVLRKLRALT